MNLEFIFQNNFVGITILLSERRKRKIIHTSELENINRDVIVQR